MAKHKFFRLYIPSSIAEGGQITTDKQQSHYLKTVLRLDVDSKVIVFNSNDGEFEGVISHASKNEVTLSIAKKLKNPENLADLTLAFAPVKNSKSEFIVEKATELGVKYIQPIVTEYTIVRKVNLERMQATAIEASEQSERIIVPETFDIITFETAIKKLSETHKIMFCDETSHISGNSKSNNQIFFEQPKALEKNHKWAIIIGPEGGFSPKERELLYSLKDKKPESILPVSLGPRILRADTATIAAITLWQNYIGDLNC